MKLFPPEPRIDIGTTGFDGIDTLGRKDFGTKLSGMLSAVEEPVVVAIDGGWGSGKTVFLKCWVGEHLKRAENTDQVIYFDAFANDFLDDPLISLISALSARPTKSAKPTIKKLKNIAVTLARPVARVALATASAGASEAVSAIAGEAAKGIDEFWKREDGRRAAMNQFRKLLGEIVEKNKLIFVIDELDRCRPDYALALLETIKHFFAVENVHFVLGVNLSELKNMVKVRYGLSTADAYLQKFIHLNMSLPARAGLRPEDTAGLVHFANIAKDMEIPSKTVEEIQHYLELRSPSPSLRDVERLATYAALVAPTLERTVGGYQAVVHGAAVLKALDHDFYKKLLAGEVGFAKVTEALLLTPNINPMARQPKAPQYFYFAWAGFMDGPIWNSTKNQFKDVAFDDPIPFEEVTQVRDVIAKHLETFQLPEPSL